MRLPNQNRPPEHAGARFTTTHWSVVLTAGQPDSPLAPDALETLCRSYWYPLYAYVRRQGHDAHEAKDLTQEFLARFLARNYLQGVDAGKGKFRSFLLSCLNHFLSNERDRAHAAKRGGGQAPVSLDALAAEETYQFEPACSSTAEDLFERRWALAVLEQALQRLQAEFESTGRRQQFEQLRGFLEGEGPSKDYQSAAVELSSTPGAVAVAVHRLRRRYRELVRSEIAQTVTNEEEIEEEMRHLFRVLSR